MGGGVAVDGTEPHDNVPVPNVQHVFQQVVDRLCQICQDVGQMWRNPAVIPDAAVRLSADKTLSEICRISPPTTAGTSPPGIIPLAFFVGLSQVADDLRFLRQVFKHCRGLTEEALRTRNATEWIAKCYLVGTPDVRCRLRPLQRIDWMHVLRTVWPQKFLEFRAAPATKPPIDVHAMHCSFAG